MYRPIRFARKQGYICYKITPSSSLSVRRRDSEALCKWCSSMAKNFSEQCYRINYHLELEPNFKMTYITEISKKNIAFYLIVNNVFKAETRERLKMCFDRCKVEECEIPEIYTHTISGVHTDNVDTTSSIHTNIEGYALDYKRLDQLSLNVEERSINTLSSILTVTDIMKGDDKIYFINNCMPKNKKSWSKHCKETHNLYLSNQKTTKAYIDFEGLFSEALSIVDDLSKAVMDTKEKKKTAIDEAKDVLSLNRSRISKSTLDKANAQIIDVQNIIISYSDSITRMRANSEHVCRSLKLLDGDNAIVSKRIKKKFNLNLKSYSYVGIPTMIMSAKELSEFIQIAGREDMQHYRMKSTPIVERLIPKDLTNGYIRTGLASVNGKKVQTYVTTDKELSNMATLLLGPSRAGKSFLINQMIEDMSNQGDSVIFFDFIKQCEASTKLLEKLKEKKIPKDKIVVINLADYSTTQAFAFNEIESKKDASVDDLYQVACNKAEQYRDLVNAMTINEELSQDMRLYLMSMSKIVMLQPNKSLCDIVKALENADLRHEYINKIPKELLTSERNGRKIEDDINAVLGLDDIDAKTDEIKGTKKNLTKGVLSRIALLTENYYLNDMYYKNPKDNLNFVDLMDQGKIVIIQIPPDKFSSDYSKNVTVSFFVNKIWLACQYRAQRNFELNQKNRTNKDMRKTVMFLDEIFQAPAALDTLGKIILQSAKFRLKTVYAIQNISDLGARLSASILSGANSDFIILPRANTDDFALLRDTITNSGFDMSDFANIPAFHSLNILNCSGGTRKCVFMADNTDEEELKRTKAEEEKNVAEIQKRKQEAKLSR